MFQDDSQSANALAAAVAAAWAEERRFVESLSPLERSADGSHERWSAKDLVAHVAAAKWRLVQAIHGELDKLDHDEPSVYAAHEGDPWSKVEADAARAASDLAACVGRMVDARWLEGRSPESFIAGYAVRHPLGHLADFHRDHGDDAEADRVRGVAAAILETLPPAVARP